MGPSTLHLLSASAVLAVGAAVAPAMSALAAPAPATHAVAERSDQQRAALTGREAQLDSAAQRVGDGGMTLVAEDVEPPVWLLLLLVPILVGGSIGVGVTLRRLQ
jgi:hypothetical protein